MKFLRALMSGSTALNAAYGGYNNDGLGRLPLKSVPSSIKFPDPMQGPPGTRKEFRFSPVSSSYQTAQDNIVRFFFNNDGIVDFTRGSIFFDLQIVATGGTPGTFIRLAQNVDSIFNRVRVTTGTELDDMREYGRLSTILWEIFRTPDAGDTSGDMYGYASAAERNTFGATTQGYMMKLQEGLFLSGVMPLGLFNQRVQLEMYMDVPTRFIETDWTGNVQFNVILTNIY